MKNLLYFTLLITLSVFLFSSFTQEEALTQEVNIENEDLKLQSCKRARINVMSSNWSPNNTACPGGSIELRASGMGGNISWTIYGATLVNSGGSTAIVKLSQANSVLSFTATDSNNCSVTLYGTTLTYHDCSFGSF